MERDEKNDRGSFSSKLNKAFLFQLGYSDCFSSVFQFYRNQMKMSNSNEDCLSTQ